MSDNIDKKENEQQEHIEIDMQTSFSLKIQEFDKKIAEAELLVAQLKKDKISYIYDQNIQNIVKVFKEKKVKEQIEQETKKKLSEQN